MLIKTLLMLLLTAATLQLQADDEHLSDQADSLDFESFHRDDKGRDLQEEVIRRRSEAEIQRQTREVKEAEQPSLVSRHPFATEPGSGLQSPAAAMDAAYREMSIHCPRGWEQEKVWSLPAAKGHQLNVKFRCL